MSVNEEKILGPKLDHKRAKEGLGPSTTLPTVAEICFFRTKPRESVQECALVALHVHNFYS